MGISDLIIATAILSGSGWLLYRSLWQKKGHCTGGCCGGCGKK
jgi:attachment p12 family protein